MKLKEYIKGLRVALKEHGNLEVITAKDDEGNGYNEVCYSPSEGIYEDGEFRSKDEYEEGEKSNAICVN